MVAPIFYKSANNPAMAIPRPRPAPAVWKGAAAPVLLTPAALGVLLPVSAVTEGVVEADADGEVVELVDVPLLGQSGVVETSMLTILHRLTAKSIVAA